MQVRAQQLASALVPKQELIPSWIRSSGPFLGLGLGVGLQEQALVWAFQDRRLGVQVWVGQA